MPPLFSSAHHFFDRLFWGLFQDWFIAFVIIKSACRISFNWLCSALPGVTVCRTHICGEMPEWSNGAVSKTVVLSRVPRVRIPVSPPPPNELFLLYKMAF